MLGKILSDADGSRHILVNPGSGRKTLNVSEWEWKILIVANSSGKILVFTIYPNMDQLTTT